MDAQIAASPWKAVPVRRVAAVALVLGSALLYSGSVGGAFVNDDRTFFVDNDDLPSLRLADAATVFVRSTNPWGDFQPLRDLGFLVQLSVFGRRPAGYHLVSIALYALSCVLVFSLARALLGSEGSSSDPEASRRTDLRALFVAALFAVHPTHVETVAYICGQKELLSGVFTLGSLIAFHRGFGSPERRTAWLAGAVILYGAAVLSKQTPIVLVALVPLLYLMAPRDRRPPAAAAAIGWATVNVPVVLWMARSREEFQRLWAANSSLSTPPLAERLPLAVKALGAHARLAAWPHPLSFGYPFDGSPGVDANLVAGGVTLILLGAVAWRFRRDAALLFSAASFVAFLVPVLQLHGSLNNASVYDRYLFLSSIGFALLVERLSSAVLAVRLRSPRAHAGAVAALVAVGAVLTVAYVPAFADDVAVAWNSHERFPGWPRASFDLAYSLVEAGRVDEVRALLARDPALASPEWVPPYFEGWALLVEARPSEAVPVLWRAGALAAAGGYYPFPSVPLGRALAVVGRLDEAEDQLRWALACPIYQPLEAHHARRLLGEIARVRAGGSALAPAMGPPRPHVEGLTPGRTGR
jgi:hypothetical protein